MSSEKYFNRALVGGCSALVLEVGPQVIGVPMFRLQSLGVLALCVLGFVNMLKYVSFVSGRC